MRFLKTTLLILFSFIAGVVVVWWAFPSLGLPLLGQSSISRPIDSVLAHPPFDEVYLCSDHPAGQLAMLGDDLGQDCVIMDFVTRDERTWLEPYRTEGFTNEDWFGWQAGVLSPCDCKVLHIRLNPRVNEPGRPHQSRAASVTLEAEDGTHFVLAHLDSFAVQRGDTVRYGQTLGKVGNNGYSRSPHVHIGAWRGRQALQILWDQQRLAQ
jgi:hypothetical protein